MRGERRRHRDENRVGLAQTIEICGRRKFARAHRGLDRRVGDMLDLALARVELADPLGVNIEADHREPGFDGGERQGNADIAKADHPDGVGPVGDPLDHGVDGFGSAGWCFRQFSPLARYKTANTSYERKLSFGALSLRRWRSFVNCAATAARRRAAARTVAVSEPTHPGASPATRSRRTALSRRQFSVRAASAARLFRRSTASRSSALRVRAISAAVSPV